MNARSLLRWEHVVGLTESDALCEQAAAQVLLSCPLMTQFTAKYCERCREATADQYEAMGVDVAKIRMF